MVSGRVSGDSDHVIIKYEFSRREVKGWTPFIIKLQDGDWIISNYKGSGKYKTGKTDLIITGEYVSVLPPS